MKINDITKRYVSIVFTNFLYIFGFLYFSWDVFHILLIVWIENFFLGYSGFVKLLFAGKTSFLRKIQLIFIFSIMFSVFFLVFGLFSFVEFSEHNVPGDFETSFQGMIFLLTGTDIIVYAVFFFLLQTYELITTYFMNKAFRSTTSEWEGQFILMRQPVLLGAVMFGSAMLRQHGTKVPGLILLVVAKIAIEVFFVWIETRDEQQSGPDIPPPLPKT